ncbi:MAG: hypothetical protein LQ340_003360 [Diploschistes diacapsis]|nr:MAG: hypothetical protein LQ340_003360 [Diploschistes diacapsis]
MASEARRHSLPYRLASAANIGIVGALCKAFTFGLNTPGIHGLDGFVGLLEKRTNPDERERGLITVSNHISMCLRSLLQKQVRAQSTSLPLSGTHARRITSAWFFSGQVLPTHRLKHSPLGGLFQPTMTEAVRLVSAPLSSPHASPTTPAESDGPDISPSAPSLSDPFSSPHLTYSTNGADTFPSPSAYAGHRYAWIHVFPEGRIHQHPRRTMRYFRWGISRLILEPDTCPDIVPMWLEGYEKVYPESRAWLRPLPRAGKDIGVWFGENVAGARTEAEGNVFEGLRRRWRGLVERDEREARKRGDAVARTELGWLSEGLMYGREAVQLREECTMEVRKAVLRLRRETGLPDEDPKAGLVETWREEGTIRGGGRMKDGSWVGDT